MNNLNEISKFIEDAIKGLRAGKATNYRYKLDDRLALFVGWSEGYGSEKRNDIIQDKQSPDYAITAGIKVWTSDDFWTDFDYLNFPYFDNGDIIDTSRAISPKESAEEIAKEFLADYEELKDYEIADNGRIIEAGVDYDRRAVERRYGLEDGALDGVSIRDAEIMVDEEEGALDRFAYEFKDAIEESKEPTAKEIGKKFTTDLAEQVIKALGDNKNPSEEELKVAIYTAIPEDASKEVFTTIHDAVKEKLSLKESVEEEISDHFTEEEQKEYGIDEDGWTEGGMEQYIHCEWCKDVVPLSDTRKELNLGHICSYCQDALYSRGEKAVYEENLENSKGLKEGFMDAIFDRVDNQKYGDKYIAKDFYDYIGHFSPKVASALDSGTEDDVREAIIDGIKANIKAEGGNPENKNAQQLYDWVRKAIWTEDTAPENDPPRPKYLDESKGLKEDASQKCMEEKEPNKKEPQKENRVSAYNKALELAKKLNKNVVYGYTTKSNPGKFFAIEPKEYDGNDSAFRKQYKANVIYVAYPDKDFVDVKEGLRRIGMKLTKLTEDKKVLKEEVSDDAYEIAEEIASRFETSEFIDADEFDEAFFDGIAHIIGKQVDFETISDEELEKYLELEKDVRGVLGYKGWETIFEGEDEGGLRNMSAEKPKANEIIYNALKEYEHNHSEFEGRNWREVVNKLIDYYDMHMTDEHDIDTYSE